MPVEQLRLNITEQEWDKAQDFFDKYPNTIKRDDKEHSFININNTIYAFSNEDKDNIDTQISSYSNQIYIRKKHAIDRQGNFVKLKITEILPNERIYAAQCKEEAKICKDVGILRGYAKDTWKGFGGHSTCYLVIDYLGQQLDKYIHDKTRSNEGFSDLERLNIAIQCAILIYKLHNGLLSIDKISYLHREIDISFFVINDDGKVFVDDFTFAKKAGDDIKGSVREKEMEAGFLDTLCYSITSPKHKYSYYTDIFALLRTLFLPESYEAYHIELSLFGSQLAVTKGDRTKSSNGRILDDDLIINNKLKFIAQKSVSKLPKYSAASIAACLILASHDITNHYELVQNDQSLAKKVIHYFENGNDKNKIKNLLKFKIDEKTPVPIDAQLLFKYPICIQIIQTLNSQLPDIAKSFSETDGAVNAETFEEAKSIYNLYASEVMKIIVKFMDTHEQQYSSKESAKDSLLPKLNKAIDFFSDIQQSSNLQILKEKDENPNLYANPNPRRILEATTETIINLACS